MKTTGLIGGSFWYSAVDYYRIIVKRSTGAQAVNHLLKFLIPSISLISLPSRGSKIGMALKIFCDPAGKPEGAGADCLLFCALWHTFIFDTAELQGVSALILQVVKKCYCNLFSFSNQYL